MITSKRTFGVEIEFFTETGRQLRAIRRKIRVESDGSLRDYGLTPYHGEYVSDILQGKSGADTIKKVCAVLNKHKAIVDDPATSMHVHLGVEKQKLVECPKEAAIIGISKLIQKRASSPEQCLLIEQAHITRFRGVEYYSAAPLTKEPKINYTYFKYQNQKFITVKNSLYFYTLFTDVLCDMVSQSRRWGNMYCLPLDKSYNLEDIARAETLDDLAGVWFKGESTEGRYNNSRYHNINFYNIWRRLGTIEIRSHGGTKDPNAILLWVKLHQYIVDKLSTMEFADVQSLEPTHKSFLDFVEDSALQSYLKRLWGFYSGISIK